ncbi:hypothetical protein [Halomicrococcus sp. NG-SE-24]|uniref:hypothetical protein n=1 Tax=Halomicrococcus sp. NG-SE-24 TaxID=3436928 RepID=UPI003D95B7BE
MFGTVDSGVEAESGFVTRLAARCDRKTADEDALDTREVADLVRDRAERIRRRELQTALRRLETCGQVAPEDRQTVSRLSARITDALVERWVANLADDGVDHAVALELLADGEETRTRSEMG